MSGTFLARLGKLWLACILFFLYAPIVVMAVMSFNASQYYQLPFEFSLKWYEKLAGNAGIIDAATRSVGIALVTTVIATILGTAASVALFRFEFRGKTFSASHAVSTHRDPMADHRYSYADLLFWGWPRARHAISYHRACCIGPALRDCRCQRTSCNL